MLWTLLRGDKYQTGGENQLERIRELIITYLADKLPCVTLVVSNVFASLPDAIETRWEAPNVYTQWFFMRNFRMSS